MRDLITGGFWAKIDHNLVCCDDKDIEEEMKTMDKGSSQKIKMEI